MYYCIYQHMWLDNTDWPFCCNGYSERKVLLPFKMLPFFKKHLIHPSDSKGSHLQCLVLPLTAPSFKNTFSCTTWKFRDPSSIKHTLDASEQFISLETLAATFRTQRICCQSPRLRHQTVSPEVPHTCQTVKSTPGGSIPQAFFKML